MINRKEAYRKTKDTLCKNMLGDEFLVESKILRATLLGGFDTYILFPDNPKKISAKLQDLGYFVEVNETTSAGYCLYINWNPR